MASNKIYTKEFVKEAVRNKFGTIKNYAEFKKISRAAMSERISKPSSKFIFELKKDGVLEDNSLIQQIGKLNSGGEMTVTANDGKGLKAEEHNTYYSDSGYKEAYYEAKERLKEAHEKIRVLEEKLKRKK